AMFFNGLIFCNISLIWSTQTEECLVVSFHFIELSESSAVLVSSLTYRCLLPLSEGACSDYALVWYFHGQSGECRPFVYGGCGGNQNRFTSRQDCESLCGTKGRSAVTQSDRVEDLPSDS
uniref:Si:dkey-117n7.5 n=1 Tax=Fundulus heteroclitus TaxID=8078 RepID=A0A3Q2R1P5_FUNHE